MGSRKVVEIIITTKGGPSGQVNLVTGAHALYLHIWVPGKSSKIIIR